ncbi:MAG TPA: ATP phosphoribosyltransferase regulatory subunit [Gammaproteobacteria bacterium]|nr:ATP phosphoribosyltransferase regulatory subunit [Gammaproteobacteria bacterium]
MSDQDRWLLPEGIEEILPDEARRLEQLRRRLLDQFDVWGYELVMPPLIEYLEALLTGTGRDLDLQTFKLTDQLTGRLMGVRADMTPQAARIDAHYLKREAPVRLCYVGSVLRTRPDVFAGSRELLQIGAELFGHPGPESDVEIAALMLATLEAAGLPELHVDLGHVGVFRGLATAAMLPESLEGELFDALQRKARARVESLFNAATIKPPIRNMLLALLDLNGGRDTLARARTLLKEAPRTVHEALDNLDSVANAIERTGRPVYFDLAELRGYRYYTGVVFSVLAPGQGQAVARGGRYDGIGQAFGRARAATGFSADLRRLLRLTAGNAGMAAAIVAPGDNDPELDQVIAHLRAQGERVIRRLPGSPVSVKTLGGDRELIRQNGQWTVKPV